MFWQQNPALSIQTKSMEGDGAADGILIDRPSPRHFDICLETPCDLGFNGSGASGSACRGNRVRSLANKFRFSLPWPLLGPVDTEH